MESLTEAVAVVTGGASGIGLAMAERFAAEGSRVVVADIDRGALDRAVEKLEGSGARALGVVTDVARADSVQRLLGATLERFGRVNVLCNNAGVQRAAPSWQMTEKEWKWLLDVNVWGVVHGIRTFVPQMLEQGDPCHVVNTASLGGLVAAPMMSAYCATKHAVVAMTECLALELKGTNVGASVLCPAFVKTGLGQCERNRPADIDDGLTEDERSLRQAIGQGAASLIDAGIEPTRVAERVLWGIREGKLFIVTHAETRPAVERRTRSILDGAEGL